MKRISECHSNFTRLDIANDIFDDSLSVPLIYSYCKKQKDTMRGAVERLEKLINNKN